jgi:hypothetical protein
MNDGFFFESRGAPGFRRHFGFAGRFTGAGG